MNTLIQKTRPPLGGRQRAIAACLLLGGLGMGGNAAAQCDLTNFGPGDWLHDQFNIDTAVIGHPCAQPAPGPSDQQPLNNGTLVGTEVTTPEGQFAPVDPFANPPGSNFLTTVDSNIFDYSNREMPNTEPSTPSVAYNLHDGDVIINPPADVNNPVEAISPAEDLDQIIDRLEKRAKRRGGPEQTDMAFALAILEGTPLPAPYDNRSYNGFPVLHINGCLKRKQVQPITDGDGTVIGGEVHVNMIYFDQHIESDTAFFDVSLVQEVPWTAVYHVRILKGGIEDFSPMVMNFNRYIDPDTGEDRRGPFHVSMDQSYFPMLEEGNEYVIPIKENKGKYYNLTYTWGWRIHPPRVQVIENALKTAGGRTLHDWECKTFGNDPYADEQAKLDAIAMIGELSPAKRMWTLFRSLKHNRTIAGNSRRAKYRRRNLRPRGMTPAAFRHAVADLRAAYLDWTDRTKLPTGVSPDPTKDATITLLYVNNTIYGSRQGLSGAGSKLGPASYKGISNGSAHDWTLRPYDYTVELLNGDHFVHGYMNVDFGGSRGWENQFQNTDPTTLQGPHPDIPNTVPPHPADLPPYNDPIANPTVPGTDGSVFPLNRGGTEEFLQPTPRNLLDPVNGDPQMGSGCFFTFGRHHSWPNAGGPWGGILVPPVAPDGTPGKHDVLIHYNFEPSRRLKIYQFDPLHHDVAVYSLH
jgi:hypothetical protein